MLNRYDLIIYGATGFAGSVATKHLLESDEFKGKRIAIAGRNKQKLEALRQTCKFPSDIIITDSKDQASVDAMVQNTRVILNFAGPFAEYAEPVISACAKLGVDYLDITGETAFIRTMMDKYQGEAERSGARLVPFCGFDSIPADLTTFLALEAASTNNLRLDELLLYYQFKGGFNGGSLATALNMAETNAHTKMANSNILIPEESSPKETKTSGPRYEPNFSRWSTSFFMAPINSAVVRWATYQHARLDEVKSEAKPDFRYEERLLLPRSTGRFKAYMADTFMEGFRRLSHSSAGRTLIRRFGLQPGQGPSEEIRLAGFFSLQLVGRSEGQEKIKISMKRQGDPGNEITAVLAIECARLAIENNFATNKQGFLPPSVAFGKHLFEHLEHAGFDFKTELVGKELKDRMDVTHDAPQLASSSPRP